MVAHRVRDRLLASHFVRLQCLLVGVWVAMKRVGGPGRLGLANWRARRGGAEARAEKLPYPSTLVTFLLVHFTLHFCLHPPALAHSMNVAGKTLD